MIEIYYQLVKAGAYTLERVPEKWRAGVKARLAQDEAGVTESE